MHSLWETYYFNRKR